MRPQFVFTECPVCGYTAIYAISARPASGFTCRPCLQDTGRVVAVTERRLRPEDRAAHDERPEVPWP